MRITSHFCVIMSSRSRTCLAGLSRASANTNSKPAVLAASSTPRRCVTSHSMVAKLIEYPMRLPAMGPAAREYFAMNGAARTALAFSASRREIFVLVTVTVSS